MKISFYDVKGNEIKTPVDPSHMWRNNKKEDKPLDFVTIKQAEIDEVVTDPYGNDQTIRKLSSPVEEVYHGWEWENGTWYCVIRLVVQKKMIVLDRRPSWWKFFEEFQANKPRSLQ